MICDSPCYGVGLGDKATLICRSTGNLPVVLLRDVHSRASYAQIWSLCPRWSKTEVAALRRDVCFAPVSGHRQAVPACPKSAGLLPRRKNRRFSRDCCVFRSKPVSDTRTAWSNSSLPSTGLNLRMTPSVKSSGCFLKRASRDDPHHHYACNKARSPCESGWARNATPSSHTPRK
jgi:hypothetical protein